MPRIRTIKPEFFSHEELSKCSPHARLLAIALLQLADSEGRMRWIPSQVIAHAFPWEAVDLSPMIHQLCTVKYLELYTVNGREYACIPAFNKHQRLSGKEAACKSKFPHIDQADTEGKTGCFTGKHLDAQEQGNKGTREQGISADDPMEGFDEFWSVYPKKEAKKAVTAKWKSRNLSVMAEQLISDVTSRLVNCRKWRDGFAPNPLTYINQDRWDDEIDTGGNNGSHQQTRKLSVSEQVTADRERFEANQPKVDCKLVGEDDTPIRT